jgi:hypothetical protein
MVCGRDESFDETTPEGQMIRGTILTTFSRRRNTPTPPSTPFGDGLLAARPIGDARPNWIRAEMIAAKLRAGLTLASAALWFDWAFARILMREAVTVLGETLHYCPPAL